MYQPSEELLEKYADLLVNFALKNGKGISKGEVVQVVVPDVAKPLYGQLQKAVLKAGGHPMMRFVATGFDKDYYLLASDGQLEFFPKKYLKTRIGTIDHTIGIIAEHDPRELEKVPPERIFRAQKKVKQIRDWQNAKELAGKYTWTLALFPTEPQANEAGLSLEESWEQVIRACYLDEKDPIAKWRKIFVEQETIKKNLNKLPIERLHVVAEGIDLWLSLGEKRQWLGGSGRNIPSFELFTSPDWRGTEGYIEFNQPLYRYGNLIEGIRLEFKKGRVVKAQARKNEKVLKEMVAQKDADKVGEFSLTDRRHSRITKFMAETLYDENIGDTFGNTHIALGMAYQEAFTGKASGLSKKEWRELGFNNSSEHTDIISTKNRTVTAFLNDGSQKIIYKDGQFVV